MARRHRWPGKRVPGYDSFRKLDCGRLYSKSDPYFPYIFHGCPEHKKIEDEKWANRTPRRKRIDGVASAVVSV
jgi:hypothetical protein